MRTKLFAVAVALIALVAIAPAAFAQPRFTLLHSFNGADGFGPMAGMVQGPDGALPRLQHRVLVRRSQRPESITGDPLGPPFDLSDNS